MKNNNLKKLEEIFDKGLDKLEVQDFTYNGLASVFLSFGTKFATFSIKLMATH